MSSPITPLFTQIELSVLSDLEVWVRKKGGRVQLKMINEFCNNGPNNKFIKARVYELKDEPKSGVQVVGDPVVPYLELKNRGSIPLENPHAAAAAASAAATAAAIALRDNPEPTSVNDFILVQKKVRQQSRPVVPLDESLEGQYVLSPTKARYVMCETPEQIRAHVNYLFSSCKMIGFDVKSELAGRRRIAIALLSTADRQVLIADTAEDAESIMALGGMKKILEDPNIIKIGFECARSVAALKECAGIEVKNVLDLAIMNALVKNQRFEEGKPCSMPDLCEEYKLPLRREAKAGFSTQCYFDRPLGSAPIEFAVRLVTLLPQLGELIIFRAKGLHKFEACKRESETYSVSHIGHARHARKYVDLKKEFEGNWECPRCQFPNFSRRTSCKLCESERPFQHRLEDDEDDYDEISQSSVASTPIPQQQSRAAPTTSTINRLEINDAALRKMEQESLELAMSLSLREEEERKEMLEKTHRAKEDAERAEQQRGERQRRLAFEEAKERKRVAELQAAEDDRRRVQQEMEETALRQTQVVLDSPEHLPIMASNVMNHDGGFNVSWQPASAQQSTWGLTGGGLYANSFSLDPNASSQPLQQYASGSPYVNGGGGGGGMNGGNAPGAYSYASAPFFMPTTNAFSALPVYNDRPAQVPPPPSAQASPAFGTTVPRQDDQQELANMLLRLDVETALEERGIDVAMYLDVLTDCATAANALDDLTQVNLVQFVKNMTTHNVSAEVRKSVALLINARKKKMQGVVG